MTIRLITPEERADSDPRVKAEVRRRVGAKRKAERISDDIEAQYEAAMQAHAMSAAAARRANGGKDPVFATGRFGVPAMQVPTRQIDDAPDPWHSPEMVEERPDYSITELMAEQWGLDAHGQPKPPDQITPEQARARARRYSGQAEAEEPIPDVTLTDGSAPVTSLNPVGNRVTLAD